MLVTALVTFGWLVWLFGLMAEADTGRPDGQGCSARIGAGYEECMRSSEIGGLVGWSVTLGLAMFGLTALGRRWRMSRPTVLDGVAGGLGILVSASLLAASVFGLLNGASGEYYEALVGSTWWITGLVLGIAGGFLVGWGVIAARPAARGVEAQPAASGGTVTLAVVFVIVLIGAFLAIPLFFFMGGPTVF